MIKVCQSVKLNSHILPSYRCLAPFCLCVAFSAAFSERASTGNISVEGCRFQKMSLSWLWIFTSSSSISLVKDSSKGKWSVRTSDKDRKRPSKWRFLRAQSQPHYPATTTPRDCWGVGDKGCELGWGLILWESHPLWKPFRLISIVFLAVGWLYVSASVFV